MKPMDLPEAWEQQEKESLSQYEKFCAYRDMRYSGQADGAMKLDLAVRRSLRELARQTGFKRQTLEDLSVRFRWVERAEAYDKEMLRIIQAKNEASIIKMHETHALLASQMLKKAAQRLLAIPLDTISAADMVRMIDTGVKIERLSRGEETENKKISGGAVMDHSGKIEISNRGMDLASLTEQELENFEQLLKKIDTEPDA